jgi:hypothetical protein
VPLSDDQKAMLRLLAQREQGYEDIGALMGLSVEEVRARVAEALAELETSGEAAPPPPEPPATAEAPVEEPPPPSPGDKPASPAAAKAEPPEPPPPAHPATPARSRTPSRPPRRPFLPKDRGARLGLGAGAAVVLLLVVLLISGAFGGGGSGSSTTTTANNGSSETTSAKGGSPTEAVLEPVGGGGASGRALFGRVGKEVVLQVVAKGLEPSSPGQSYTVWLYRSPKLALRVGAAGVGKSGGLAARFPVPAELLAYVASGAFDNVYVSSTDDAAYKAEVARARAQKRLPRYTGTTVLRGEITGPIVKK